MKKVLIVSPGGLPIPAVKGGAVETLIEYLINENELESNFIFTVVSCENNDARIKSCNYNNTNFIYIRINAIFNNITKKICRGLNRIFNVNIPLNLIYYHSIFNQIKELHTSHK